MMKSSKESFALGSYTEPFPHVSGSRGEGISFLTLDEESGEVSCSDFHLKVRNPSYLAWASRLATLYAVTETRDCCGEVRSFQRNSQGEFFETACQTGPGRAGCHLCVILEKSSLFAASYMDGCLKGYALENGQLGNHFYECIYSGRGPNDARQREPHAHQVLSGPDKRYLYVCDLGADRIWKHDLQSGNFAMDTALTVPPGYGPRHLAFDPQGDMAYILCELEPRLLAVRIDQENGKMTILKDIDATGGKGYEAIAPAAVKIHPSGKTLAVSNRFADTIALFGIERKDRDSEFDLLLLQVFSSGGRTPRDIAFSQSGRWLLAANQDSSSLAIFSFNPLTGDTRGKITQRIGVGTPVCITCISPDSNLSSF